MLFFPQVSLLCFHLHVNFQAKQNHRTKELPNSRARSSTRTVTVKGLVPRSSLPHEGNSYTDLNWPALLSL